MATQYLPVFKQSGLGLSQDLMTIKKQEAIAMGWLKGQYIYYMPKLAGYTTIDGKRCYGERITINQYTKLSDTSAYGKDLKRFLKALGYDNDDLSNIYETSIQDRVNGISLIWQNQMTFEQSDFEFIFDLIKTNSSNIDRVELNHNNIFYNVDETNRPALTSYSLYSSYGSKYEFEDFTNINGIVDSYVSTGIVINSSAKYYDEFNNEILDIDDYLDLAIRTCLILSGDTFATLTSLVKTGETPIYGKDFDGNTVQVEWQIDATEYYDFGLKESFKNSYSRFKADKHIGSYDNDGNYINSRDLLPLVCNNYWLYGEKYGLNGNLDSRQSIFYQPRTKFSFISSNTQPIYMTVDGLKRANPNELIYYTSKFAKFDISIQRKKSGFFGVGGFLGNLLSGFMNLVVKVVSAVASLGYYIPIIRLQIQALTWIFSGKLSSDRKRFNQVATRVLLSILAVVIIILTGGSGWQIALSLLTSAISLYTGLKEFDDMMDSLKNTTEENIEDKIQEQIIDLKQKENDYLYDGMFNTFDDIDSKYSNPFDGAMYNPEFGLKLQ